MTCAASGGKVTSLIFCCCCLFNFQFPPGVTQRVHMCERRAYLYLLQLLWWEQSDNIGVITCGWNDIIICALYYVFFSLCVGRDYFSSSELRGDWQQTERNVFACSDMKTVQVQWNDGTEMGKPNYGFVFIVGDYLALWMLFFFTVQRQPISHVHTNADKGSAHTPWPLRWIS